VIAAVLSLALAATGGASAGVDVRSGYDSNIYFGAVQDLAIASQSSDDASFTAHDAFVSVHPQLSGQLQLGRVQLHATGEAALVQYAKYTNGYYRVFRASADQSLTLGRLSLGLFELGDDYAISAFRSDRMQRLLGGVDAGTTLGGVEVMLRLEGGVRHFPFRESAYQVLENDPFFAPTGLIRVPLGSVTVDGWLRAERRTSNAVTAEGDTEQAELGATWSRGALDVAAHLNGRRLWLSHFPISDFTAGREDLELGVRGEAGYRWGSFRPGLELSWERNVSNYGLGIFSRTVAAVSFAWSFGWSPAPTPAAAPLPGHPGRYRLEVDLPEARVVSVIGSFQGWRSPGLPLTRTSSGHFAVELDLPPGRYRYQLIVDGARLAPPNAEGYEPDGLGGTDAVLVVGGASEPGDVR